MCRQPTGPRKTILFLYIQVWMVLGATAAYGQVQPRVVDAIDNAQRVTLAGNVLPLARAEFDRGAVTPAQPMTRILLLLKRSDAQELALQDFMEKQQDKSSPNYHAWLTPQEFGAQYGPADADIQAVTQWLGSQGFTVEKVYSGKTVIEFSGTAGQVLAAFGTEIRNYQVADKTYVANASDPQIPAALAPVVAGIVSLNNFPRQSHAVIAGRARKIAGKPGLEPLFTFPNPFGGGGNFYGLGPGDFATIYNSNPLLQAATPINGTGQTIAIVGETNILVADVVAFRKMFGLPASFSAANVILNGEDPGITSTGEEGEADLDTQWSGAVAPGATVDLVVSASTPASAGVDLSALYIIEENFAGVMSESYGSCEAGLGSAGNAFYNSMWEQAAAQGITVMVSSGDNGSAACDNPGTQTQATSGLAVSGLASTPYNVAVGGTDFDDVNNWTAYWNGTNGSTGSLTGVSALSYIPEIPWNQNCAQLGLTGCGASAPNGSVNIVAGSGGASNSPGKPTWQMGVTGMPNDNHRDLPDVSLLASPGFNGTGYLYCQSDHTLSGLQECDINNSNGELDFGVVGGTSASAPAFAGVMALVNQYQAAHGGTGRQGNANYVLYALAKKPGASCASSPMEAAACIFNDVTKGNSYLALHYPNSVGTNSVACQGASLNCSVAIASGTGVLVDPAHPSTEAWTATAGYDRATGLGSVNINNLVTNWGTVSTVATTTTLTLSPSTGITHGTTQSVSVNITVTPSTATGDVSLIAKFADGTTQGLDGFTLTSGKVVNGTTSSLPGGSYTVIAHYAGDGTRAPGDSAPVPVTVGQETSQTFVVIPTFDSNGNQLNGNATSVTYGSNYIIRMYVTDKNAVGSTTGPPSGTCDQINVLTCPTGTVTLTNNGAAVGTGGGGAGVYNLNNAGYTRNINPMLGGGSYQLLAHYSGDNSYQTSTGMTTLTITPAAATLSTPFSGMSPFLVGSPAGIGADLMATFNGGAAPTGAVTFYDGATQLLGTVNYVSIQGTSGSPGTLRSVITTTFTNNGTHTITAKYSGDNNYAAATSSALTETSVYQTTLALALSTTSIVYGQNLTVTATVTTSAKNPPITGQIYFSGNPTNQVNGTLSTDASGNQVYSATVTTTLNSSDYIQAIYQGDANYAGSDAMTWVNVNIPDFTLGPAAGISVVPVAGQIGSGQITISPVSPTQPGSPVNLSLSQLVISGYTITLSPQQVNLNGVSITSTITLTPTVAVPASAITTHARHAGIFAIGRNNCWMMSLATGLFAIFLLGFPGRRRRYRAALGLSMVSLLLFVIGCGGGSGTGGGGGGGGGGGPVATTITLMTSNAKVVQNAPFTITATVTSTKPLTGTVNFYNFGTAFAGGFPVSASGQATTGQGYLNNPGVYQVTASYSGDANNLASTSAPLIQVITGTMPATVSANTGADIHSLQVTLGIQ